MKKGKKIGFVLLILFILGGSGFCFWRGWLQFAVGIDECGVLLSKTGGVFEKPITKGYFLWRWEPLLPTNTRLLTFPMQSEVYHRTMTGELPSATLYGLQIQHATDFAYEFNFDIALQIKPDAIVSLVKENKIQSEENMHAYLEQSADRIAVLTAQFLLAESLKNPQMPLTAFSTEQLISGIGSAGLDGVEIRNLFVKAAKVPDVELYNKAKDSYDGFQNTVNEELRALARKQAESIVADNRAVNKLTKIGETLKKYPELADVLKNSDTAAVLKALDMLQ